MREGLHLSETRGFLRPDDIDNPLTKKRLEQLNTTHRWLFDLSRTTLDQLGFEIINDQLGIKPISVEQHMSFLGLRYEPYLVHHGFYSSEAILDQDNGQETLEPFDNLTNLRRHQLWGSPKQSHATFLKPSFSRVVPNPRRGAGRKLYVDLIRLQRIRPVYPDPEMFMPFGERNFNGVEFDMPGHAYMVFGGIPIETIRRHEDIRINAVNQ